MKKILFIDRDGTIIAEPDDEQIDDFQKLEFIPGAITCLSRIAQELDFDLVMVTNQDGLGSPSFPEERFWPIQEFLLKTLRGEGISFSEVLIDRHREEDNSPFRKPGTAMLTHYLKGNFNLAGSFVIGDRSTDVQLAKNLGAGAIFIGTEANSDAALSTTSWKEIYHFLKNQGRTAVVSRNTKETQIMVRLNLDGTGQSRITTGIGFFDHMLDQLAKHGGIDLNIQATGDTHIDEHHTVEDVALALGQAFKEALGSKKGIARYGFLLPMDDCLAQVSIDFGGRPWLVWDATFNREKIGGLPTEMISHFFKSFSDEARCNLNIRADGSNEHHKVESIFKAWAKSIMMAVQQSGDGEIPSTKGIL